MKAVIFGASGNVGRMVVYEMLKRGHDVTAFVYGPNPFKQQDRLEVIQGDVHSEDDIDKAIKGQDVVLSALGSWGTPTKDIQATAMGFVVPAMKKHKLRRIISLTGADARDLGDKPNTLNVLSRSLFGIVAGKVLHDGEEHIRLLRASDLDWTVVRSPVMRNKGKDGTFRLGVRVPTPWASINRTDVVNAMVDLSESRDYVKQSPFISRK